MNARQSAIDSGSGGSDDCRKADSAFIERLLAEEGIGCRLEHAGAPGDVPLGTHTLVLFDH